MAVEAIAGTVLGVVLVALLLFFQTRKAGKLQRELDNVAAERELQLFDNAALRAKVARRDKEIEELRAVLSTPERFDRLFRGTQASTR